MVTKSPPPNPDAGGARKGWKWEDGKYHPEPPPSSQTMAVAEPPAPTNGSGAPDGAPKPGLANRPAVPSGWLPSPRTDLRVKALDFAIRAAALNAHGRTVVSGAEILSEAEHIERWIAEPQSEKGPPG